MCYGRNRKHPKYDSYHITYRHHRNKTQTHYNETQKHAITRTTGYCYSNTVSQKQVHLFCSSTMTKSFQWNPSYFISRSTFTLIMLGRWCQVLLPSHFISPVITPEQANPRWCLYLKRTVREKSCTVWGLHHRSLHQHLSALLSTLKAFQVTFQLTYPHIFMTTGLLWVPCTMRYGWVLLVCFLYFTIAISNLNLPGNWIDLCATILFSLFFFKRDGAK